MLYNKIFRVKGIHNKETKNNNKDGNDVSLLSELQSDYMFLLLITRV
jgi:hypothetical protein